MTELPLTGRARPDCTPHSLSEYQALGSYSAVSERGTSPGTSPNCFIVNGDEMEPGAFKDRILMKAVPHQSIEAPMGTTAAELITRCGGVSGNGRLRCFQPGGGAIGFLLPDGVDVPMDFGQMAKAGSMFGTGTLIVLDETACPLAVTARHMALHARECCGWRTPCRDDLAWVARIMRALEAGSRTMEDIEVLRMHVKVAGPRGPTFCDLMGGAMRPLGLALRLFADLFEYRVQGGCCPIHRDFAKGKAA